MTKDFATWAIVQANLEKNTPMPYCPIGSIFWCSLGVNIGHEEDGKGRNFTRPVLTLHNFSNKMSLIVPITSQPKTGKNYCPIAINGTIEYAIISQLRTIDTRRLGDLICKIDKQDLSNIKQLIAKLIL